MSKVLILGCGPAGLFAAWAAERCGHEVIIVSKKRKSEMFGAQYLHQPIPDISADEPFQVTYQLEGTVQGYKDKVYGPGYRGTVSPEDLTESHEGWDIRDAYSALWVRYQNQILNAELDGYTPQMISRIEGVGHYISTIPAPLLCNNPAHSFQSQKVWSIGDAPERGVFSPITVPLNTVVCNGADSSWYRAANILGYHTVEWPEKKRPPIEGVTEVIKPVSTNCDCLPHVHRLGRYGKWQKGVLSHEAYYETEVGLGEAVPAARK